jgi:hypothetical protein
MACSKSATVPAMATRRTRIKSSCNHHSALRARADQASWKPARRSSSALPRQSTPSDRTSDRGPARVARTRRIDAVALPPALRWTAYRPANSGRRPQHGLVAATFDRAPRNLYTRCRQNPLRRPLGRHLVGTSQKTRRRAGNAISGPQPRPPSGFFEDRITTWSRSPRSPPGFIATPLDADNLPPLEQTAVVVPPPGQAAGSRWKRGRSRRPVFSIRKDT